VGQEIFPKWLSPEKLFRFIALFCLVAMGLSMIYTASHVADATAALAHSKDLVSYFFTAIWIFVFFYAQYRLVPRFTKIALNERIGYGHALGCAGLLLVGGLNALMPQGTSDVPGTMLFWLTLLGEGAFIANVAWSYTHAGAPVPVLPAAGPSPRVAAYVRDDSAKNLGWPKSPVKLFAIGAAVFAGGGIVSLILNVPSGKVLVPWSGQTHFFPFGVLWLAAAVPFAVFAMLYKFVIDSSELVFEESMNRLHFVVTIIAVLDLVRAFGNWQEAMVSPFMARFFGPEAQWLIVLFGLSAVVFAINAFRSYRRKTARP